MSRHNEHRSLSEVHESVDTKVKTGFFKKLLAFMGPAYLVSVGYMDPGNWATDIAGGSQFGYSLLWVLLMSNLMALLLQSLSARLGLVRGRDLAQASREHYGPVINFFLYILAEIAIAACDLAEVLGMAIGLQLLFNLPLLAGVCISVLDTFLLLFLINYGIRKMEAFILTLVAIIGLCFFTEMIFASPSVGEVAKGFVPYLPNDTALYIAIGIIGATVMPHNLYLHSSLVQSRTFHRDVQGIKKAINFNIIDSVIALNAAFFVNAAILILAATAFYSKGNFEVAEIQQAYRFLEPALGTRWASILFAVALLAAGQSSTITGTLAGQIVMEGYLNLRIQPWIRRILTRLIAIVPAFITIYYFGEEVTGKLLVLSQVILSLQLGFAIIPLIHFVSNRKQMREFTISLKTKIASWCCAIIIVGLNVKLVIEVIGDWLQSAEHPDVLYLTVIPVAILAFLVLAYITIQPFFVQALSARRESMHGNLKALAAFEPTRYRNIAITVDFSDADSKAINHALAQGGSDATYTLIHVLETAGALVIGSETSDLESHTDTQFLNGYSSSLNEKGFKTEVKLGYGNPKKAIPAIVNELESDLLVMGAHGHTGIKDLLLGTTLDTVRHRVNVPVLIVQG